MKTKLVAGIAAIALAVSASAGAAANSIGVERIASPVDEAEEAGGSELVLAGVVFAAITVGVILATESNSSNDLPDSP